jgi:two-component sensor histidine kinase
LDENVEFDEIADRLRITMSDLSPGAGAVTSTRTGAFGTIPGEIATPLAMVLTEILQNAAEHGFPEAPGTVNLDVARETGNLVMTVTDDGIGLPEGFDPETSVSLGLSIVRTLVESELMGSLEIGPAERRGTRVRVTVPLS